MNGYDSEEQRFFIHMHKPCLIEQKAEFGCAVEAGDSEGEIRIASPRARQKSADRPDGKLDISMKDLPHDQATRLACFEVDETATRTEDAPEFTEMSDQGFGGCVDVAGG